LSKPRSGAPKRLAAGVLASSLAVFGLAFAPSAGATATVTTEQFAGANRYDTAKLIAADEAFAAPKSVIVASGENKNFPDALAAATLAGTLDNTPIVTTSTAALSPEASAALTALKGKGVTTAHIVGGTSAVSQATETAITALGLTVTRHAGSGTDADRYGTAAKIATDANAIQATGSVNGLKTAFFATGSNFADAVSAAPGAYASRLPVLLVSETVPASTTAAIASLGIKKAVVLGGTGAVSDAVATQLATLTGNPVDRLQGTGTSADRFGTAAAIAEYEVATLGFGSPTAAILANGTDAKGGVDALASGPLGGELKVPVLLVASLPEPTRAFLDKYSTTISKLYAAGGSQVIDSATLAAAVTAAQTVSNDSNQSLSVSPTAASSKQFQNEAGATPTADDVTCTVSGLDNTKQYDIALFPGANVTNSSGIISFKDSDGTANVADDFGSTAVAQITNVNNAANGPGGSVNNATPVNGVITFIVDGTAPGTVTPVVFLDNGTTANNLDLDSNDRPTEAFGLCGPITYTAPAATASADADDAVVVAVDKAANTFNGDTADPTAPAATNYSATAADVIYTYDDNDSFSLGGVPATLADFEAQLSRGDGVTIGSYSPTAALVSVFNISDDSPDAPAVSAAAGGAGQTVNDITVTIAGSDITNEALYNTFTIQRAPSATPTAWSTIATVAGTADADAVTAEFQYVDTDVAAGGYVYRALGTIDGDSSPYSTATGTITSTTPGPDVTAPTVVANGGVQDVDGTFTDVLDTGDRFILYLDEAVTVASNAAVIVSDGADTGTLTNGGNATFTTNSTAVGQNAANTILTILVNSPVLESPSNDVVGAASYTLTNRSGITDASGNALALTGDNTLEDDGPEFFAETCTVGATTCTLTFNEALTTSANVPANYGFTDVSAGGVTITTAVLGADGRTVTLTFSGALGAGDTIDPQPALVDTDGQGATQGATVIA
jgi:putative cell wall-binding protein